MVLLVCRQGQEVKHEVNNVVAIAHISYKSLGRAIEIHAKMEEPRDLVDVLACQVGQEHAANQVGKMNDEPTPQVIAIQ